MINIAICDDEPNIRACLSSLVKKQNTECEITEYGVMFFNYDGSRQIIPNYAVPKINTTSLSGICAVNNSLVLNNKSYYAWTTLNGSRYTWTVNNGRIGWA